MARLPGDKNPPKRIRRNDHPTKVVELPAGGKVDIDEEIAPLIKALNVLGWITHMSCQSNVDGRVWISFYQPKSAEMFMELIADESKTLRRYIRAATTEAYDRMPRRWKFKDRWWVDCYETFLPNRRGSWTGDICIRISIRFPKEHLEEVTKIVKKEVKRVKKFDHI